MQDDPKISGRTGAGAGGDAAADRDIRAMRHYWNSMRHGSDVPRRSDIDPRGIENLLEYAFIAEKIAPGQARMRIAGTKLADLMGMEVRGMPLSAFFDPAARDRLADLLVEVFEAPATLEIDLLSAGDIGKPELQGKLILLPLRSDLGDVSRALGALVVRGAYGRSPRRFAITGTRIDAVAQSGDDATQGLAEAPAVFSSERSRHRSERRYLRVVK